MGSWGLGVLKEGPVAFALEQRSKDGEKWYRVRSTSGQSAALETVSWDVGALAGSALRIRVYALREGGATISFGAVEITRCTAAGD